MKKKNSYIWYALFFGACAIALYSWELATVDVLSRAILLCCGGTCLFLCALMCKGAYQTRYYNKAIDAWANWYEEVKKREEIQTAKKIDLPFKEFDVDNKE